MPAIQITGVTVKAVKWEINMTRLTDNADKIRMEFARLSDEEILNFVISFSSENFITLTDHVQQEVKKLVDSQPF